MRRLLDKFRGENEKEKTLHCIECEEALESTALIESASPRSLYCRKCLKKKLCSCRNGIIEAKCSSCGFSYCSQCFQHSSKKCFSCQNPQRSIKTCRLCAKGFEKEGQRLGGGSLHCSEGCKKADSCKCGRGFKSFSCLDCQSRICDMCFKEKTCFTCEKTRRTCFRCGGNLKTTKDCPKCQRSLCPLCSKAHRCHENNIVKAEKQKENKDIPIFFEEISAFTEGRPSGIGQIGQGTGSFPRSFDPSAPKNPIEAQNKWGKDQNYDHPRKNPYSKENIQDCSSNSEKSKEPLEYQLKKKKLKIKELKVLNCSLQNEINSLHEANSELMAGLREASKKLSGAIEEIKLLSEENLKISEDLKKKQAEISKETNSFSSKFLEKLFEKGQIEGLERLDSQKLQEKISEIEKWKKNIEQGIFSAQEQLRKICDICFSKKKNRVLKPCGHTICSKCFEKIKKGSNKCPHDQGVIQEAIMFYD